MRQKESKKDEERGILREGERERVCERWGSCFTRLSVMFVQLKILSANTFENGY